MSQRYSPLPASSLFSSISPERVISVFREAVDSSPDVLRPLRSVTGESPSVDFTPSRRTHSPDLRAVVPISKSGYCYGINHRFRSRPESTVDSGLGLRSAGNGPALRFQSRTESHTEMTPGPQTYVVHVPANPALGVMLREPKFREKREPYTTFIGPGSYDVRSEIGHSPGCNFSKGQRENPVSQSTETVPGPGQYSKRSLETQPAYSFPRSASPLYTESDHLGPGYYRLPDHFRRNSGLGKFAASPRFRESSNEKLESRL